MQTSMTAPILEKNQTISYDNWIAGLTRVYNLTPSQQKLIDPKIVEEANKHFEFQEFYKLVDQENKND